MSKTTTEGSQRGETLPYTIEEHKKPNCFISNKNLNLFNPEKYPTTFELYIKLLLMATFKH